MKLLIRLISVYLLAINFAVADQGILFLNEPIRVSSVDAIESVRLAAINRQWSIEREDNRLVIELEHKGYLAKLQFFINRNYIYYKDFSKKKVEVRSRVKRVNPTPSGPSRNNRSSLHDTNVPDRWIAYLKHDAQIYLFNKSGNVRAYSARQSKEVRR